MLTSRLIRTPSGAEYVLIINESECEVCHRTSWRCLEAPWANHDFAPATSGADNLPASWESLPITYPTAATTDTKEQTLV